MFHTVVRPATSTISVATHPIYSMLLPIPVVCFLGALATDLAYSGSNGNLLWLNFSSWLLAAGLLFGAIAGIVLLVELILHRGLRRGGAWTHSLLLLAAWIVEFINSLVHARDGWTAVVPTGMVLSIFGALLVLASGWVWRSARYQTSGEPA